MSCVALYLHASSGDVVTLYGVAQNRFQKELFSRDQHQRHTCTMTTYSPTFRSGCRIRHKEPQLRSSITLPSYGEFRKTHNPNLPRQGRSRIRDTILCRLQSGVL